MKEVVNLLGNLTLFSVMEILFVQQDYRTINFLTEGDRHNEMMQIASKSLIPISHFVIGELNPGRSRSEAPILNVVVPDHLKNGTIADLVRGNIFPDDVTLILPSQSYNENEDIQIKMWMNLSTKVLLLTTNLTLFYNTFEHVPSSKINLFPFDPISSRNSIENVFSTEYFSRQQRNFTVFFQFFPPRSSVGTFGQDFILIGPDGSLASIIVKWLKVKPVFCSDLALSYPDYENWGDNPVISSRMHYQYYYPKVMTKNILKVFNRR